MEGPLSAVGTVLPRAVGLIALVALTVLALRGFIPGSGGPHAASPPSAVSVALMPVLSLVSVVILLAGVLTSQHRLPLARPHHDRVVEKQPWQLRRLGLFVLVILAAIALLTAVVWAVFLLTSPHAPVQQQAPPSATAAPPPSETAPPTPHAFPATPELSSRALILVGITTGLLVLVAIAGLATVAVAARRRPDTPEATSEPAPATPPVSLADVAEMGLAAIVASGQDARTAIISCYVAMESGLARAREVAPLISDTPSEVLARAFDRGVLRDASARELVALFEEARFSPHSMLDWQRMRAEQLLRIALRDLQGAQL